MVLQSFKCIIIIKHDINTNATNINQQLIDSVVDGYLYTSAKIVYEFIYFVKTFSY